MYIYMSVCQTIKLLTTTILKCLKSLTIKPLLDI